MIYYATFTLLINGAVWGTHEEEFETDSIEELFENVKEWEENHETDQQEYLLDFIDNENGEEVKENYFEWLEDLRNGKIKLKQNGEKLPF